MTTTETTERTFRLVNGRPVHNLTPDADVTTGGAQVIPDVSGMSLPDAARVWRAHNSAVFPWRLVDGGKNLGAFIGRGYHQLAAAIDPNQAYELFALDPSITGAGLSAGRSGLTVYDIDRPELCPPLLRRAIEETSPPYQTTRDEPVGDGLLARGHYVFKTPPGRRLGSPTKWTGGSPECVGWGEVRSWNSGIAIAPGLHPKADQGGRYSWPRTGPIPDMPFYLAVEMPEFTQTADRATKQEIAAIKASMTRQTDPSAVQRAVERHDDGTLSGRHGATLNLALDLYRDMIAGRITYTDATNAVHAFFYSMVTDPSRFTEPTLLCEWALGQVLSDAATGGVPGLANAGVPTELPDDADHAAVVARTVRTNELYRMSAGRPIGLADDIARNRAILGSAARRVANTATSTQFVRDLDHDLVELLLDRIVLGSPRAGSTEKTIAAHTARAEALDESIETAVRVSGGDIEAEVQELTADEGVGARLDAVRHARWAKLTDADLAQTIVRGYARAANNVAVDTPNLDKLARLSKERQAAVLGQLHEAYRKRADQIAAVIGTMEPPSPELPQPRPERRVPINLDSDELRIDGVNTYLNTWSPDPEDVLSNGDLFIYRGAPALFTHRGGHIAERRSVKPLAPYELIAVTNERADVQVTNKVGEVVVGELNDHQAKVGLAAVRRTLARTLNEVATTPIITPDGTLVEDRTYDSKTGVLVAYSTPHVSPPTNPTDDQVAKAMEKLNDFYGDVAFVTDGDGAAFWAYLFSIPLRRWINGEGWTAAPALGVRAGKANAGKTLVTTAIGGLHGYVSLRLPSTEEELHKRILSAYESNQSAQVLVLNNVPNGTKLDSAALAEVVTEPVVQGRKLGFTGQDIAHTNNKTLIVNGNRWHPADDLVSRFIPCAIKPHVGAETRTFKTPDLQQRLDRPEHHSEVLTALLTVINGWLRAGAKKGESHGFRGNFTRWVETMDGVLTYAGIKGFGENFHVFADLDESEDEDFLAAMVDYFGEGVTFTREQVEKALRKADRDPAQDPFARQRTSAMSQETAPAPGEDPKFKELESLRQRMPRDSKAPSPTVMGLRAPLSGRKLARMLNQQLDMPIEREGKALVKLTQVKVNGERCWRFDVEGEASAVDDTPMVPAATPAAAAVADADVCPF